MSLVPIYLYEDGAELPEEGNYFVVAKNGVFMNKNAGLVSGLVKVDLKNLPGLGEISSRVRLNLPKIPVEMYWKSLVFFRRVWFEHRSEAAVVLFYNEQTKEYFLHCPNQEVSAGSVNYGVMDGKEDPAEVEFIQVMRKKGYKRVGTIHSHCDFSAFHSGTDTNDEAKFDGVHITIGHVNRRRPSVVASLVVNDNRFQTCPTKVIGGLIIAEAEKTYSYAYRNSQDNQHFDVELTEEEREAIVETNMDEMDQVWMKRVSKHSYMKNFGFGFGNSSSTHVSACVTPENHEPKKLILPPIPGYGNKIDEIVPTYGDRLADEVIYEITDADLVQEVVQETVTVPNEIEAEQPIEGQIPQESSDEKGVLADEQKATEC